MGSASPAEVTRGTRGPGPGIWCRWEGSWGLRRGRPSGQSPWRVDRKLGIGCPLDRPGRSCSPLLGLLPEKSPVGSLFQGLRKPMRHFRVGPTPWAATGTLEPARAGWTRKSGGPGQLCPPVLRPGVSPSSLQTVTLTLQVLGDPWPQICGAPSCGAGSLTPT